MSLENFIERETFIKNLEIIKKELQNKKVIIYGLGKIGKLLLNSLNFHNINVCYLWDNNYGIVQRDINNLVSKPDLSLENKDDYIIFVTIFANQISEQIAYELKTNNFKTLIYKKELIYNLIYSMCHQKKTNDIFEYNLLTCHMCPLSKEIKNRCEIFDNAITISSNNKKIEDKIIIPSMGVLITNKCNLTCEGCNHLRDHYNVTDHIDMETSAIVNDLKKIIQSIDFIEKVVIVGGEAFVHKDVFNIFNEIMKLDKIGIIHIITNGTILIKNENIYKLLSNKRVIVEISGYGDMIPKPLQQNVEKFINNLQKYKINYSRMDTLQWYDFGDFKYRSFTKEQHHKIYKSCCFVSNDLFNGKIYKCSRSALGMHISKIPDYRKDYVDVRGLSVQDLRTRINEFLNLEYPEVCQHCSGTSTNTINAGVQKNEKLI